MTDSIVKYKTMLVVKVNILYNIVQYSIVSYIPIDAVASSIINILASRNIARARHI